MKIFDNDDYNEILLVLDESYTRHCVELDHKDCKTVADMVRQLLRERQEARTDAITAIMERDTLAEQIRESVRGRKE